MNVHFRTPAVPPELWRDAGFVGLIGGTAEWVFAKPGVVSVTISAANHLVDLPADELAAPRWSDVRRALGIETGMPPMRVVKEKRATFAATAAQERRRPGPRTRLRNLALAGDWTATGLPATIEGAIRSGRVAAASAARRRLIGLGTCHSEILLAPQVDELDNMPCRALATRCSAGRSLTGTGCSSWRRMRRFRPNTCCSSISSTASTPTSSARSATICAAIQGAHGGWPLFHDGKFDLSASVKAYFALKVIGDDPDAPHMARARAAILAAGGAERTNVFTRAQLALIRRGAVARGAGDAGGDHAAAALVSVPPREGVVLVAHRARCRCSC